MLHIAATIGTLLGCGLLRVRNMSLLLSLYFKAFGHFHFVCATIFIDLVIMSVTAKVKICVSPGYLHALSEFIETI